MLYEVITQFVGRHDVTGMEVSGLIASGNRDKLLTMARELQMPVDDDVLFISEGKEPGKISGLFFTLMAVLGLIKVFQMMRKKGSGSPAPLSPQE